MTFARGGYHWNYWVTTSPNDPNWLALLSERVLRTGYELPLNYELTVYCANAVETARLLIALAVPAPLTDYRDCDSWRSASHTRPTHRDRAD